MLQEAVLPFVIDSKTSIFERSFSLFFTSEAAVVNMKMTMTEDEILGRIKMGVNVDIKRSDGKLTSFKILYKKRI